MRLREKYYMTQSFGFGGKKQGVCHHLHKYDVICKVNQLTSNVIIFHACSENHLFLFF